MSSTKFVDKVTGQIETYADSDLTPGALSYLEARGLRPATDEDVAARERTIKYSGAGEQAQAQAERVVRGATLGQVEGFGSDEANRARADVSEQQHPILSALADVAPDIAITALSEGMLGPEVIAARGARLAARAAAGAITGGAVAASQQAYQEGRQFLHEDIGRDVENLAIWTGLGGALGAVGYGASRLLRGGKSAGKAAGEVLEATANAAEARALEGLPMAGTAAAPGTIAAVEETGKLAGRAERKVATEAAQEAADAAAPNGVDQAVRKATASEADDVVRQAMGGELAQEAPGIMRDRRLHDYRHEIMETANKQLRDDLDNVRAAHRDITDVATAKPKDIERNIGKNLEGQRAQLRQVATQAAEFAGTLRAEATQYATETAAAAGREAKKLRPLYQTKQHLDWVSSLTNHAKELETAAAGTSGPKMYEALENFKRVADDRKLALEHGAINANDPLHVKKLVPRVEEFANSIRSSLEDANTWGRLGEMQSDYNRIWSDKFIPAAKVFDEAAFKVTGSNYQGKLISEAWESKLEGLLKGTDAGNRRHVGDMLDAMQEGAAARLKYGGAIPAEMKNITDRVSRIKRTLALGDEVQAASRRMEPIQGVAGRVAGGLFGGALGGLPGAAGGALAGGALSGDLGYKLRTLTGATDSVLSRSVDDWIRTSKVRGGGAGSKLASLRFSPPALGESAEIAKVAAKRGVTIGVARFMGDDESIHAAFARKRDALMDDEALFQRIGQNFGALATDSPAALMAISGHIARVRQFLVTRMPASIAVSLRNPRGYPPSRDAIEDWSIYWNAATEPVSVVRSLAKGDIQVQEVETLRELYPRLYEGLQEKVLTKIADNPDLDDRFLMRMNLLFDLDGAGSPIFSMRLAREMAQQRQGAPALGLPPAATKRPPKAAERLTTANPGLTGATTGTQG